MSETAFYSPRNDNAVDYALQITRNYLSMLARRAIALDGATVVEIGPGADFGAALAIASRGATVALADRFLAPWDPAFHPDFYRAFLDRYDGPNGAIRAVVERGSYEGVLLLLPEAAENLRSLKDASVDVVLSNAVLEHVRDLAQVAREMARITRTGGTHSHQIDCRDHKDFGRPLDHLLIPEAAFAVEREKQGCMRGTQMRMQEIAEIFAPDFWLDEMEPNCFAESDYLDEIAPALQGRFTRFPRQSLRITGGRLWLTRKRPTPKPRRRLFGLG